MGEYSKFLNREEAGKFLARKLMEYKNDDSVIILALPRGGVPVGYVIAYALHKPLDIYLVKKIGVPGQEELAMGAVSTSGEVSIDSGIVERLHISDADLNELIDFKKAEIKDREQLLRGSKPPLDLSNRTVILVDDGLATGATMLTAIRSIKKLQPAKIIAAIPVASRDAIEMVQGEVDEAICLLIPDFFYSVSVWYSDFRQTTDEEVINLLNRSSDLFGDNYKKSVAI
jgi:putative phosphoribosyl transferase